MLAEKEAEKLDEASRTPNLTRANSLRCRRRRRWPFPRRVRTQLFANTYIQTNAHTYMQILVCLCVCGWVCIYLAHAAKACSGLVGVCVCVFGCHFGAATTHKNVSVCNASVCVRVLSRSLCVCVQLVFVAMRPLPGVLPQQQQQSSERASEQVRVKLPTAGLSPSASVSC